MPAEVRNITIEQGATKRLEFTWREGTPEAPGDPIPLTGGTVTMQVRKRQGDSVLLEATSDDDITVDGPAGHVTIVLPASKTTLLTQKSCRYDVKVAFSVDDVHRLLKGSVTVDPAITQSPGDPVVSSG